MGIGFDDPTAADYAYSDAQDAKRLARNNGDRIERLASILELVLLRTEAVQPGFYSDTQDLLAELREIRQNR